MYFNQLEDSLLIDLKETVLTAGEVIGKKLKVDIAALTPIVGNMLEGYERIH